MIGWVEGYRRGLNRVIASIFIKNSLKNVDLNGDGKMDGFSFEVKNNVQTATLAGLSVEVDGEEYPRDLVGIEVSGRDFKWRSLSSENTVSFPLGETAKITVTKKGGLPLGEHAIRLKVTEVYFGAFTFSTEETI